MASLGKEVDELRAEVAALKEALAALGSNGAATEVAAATTAAAATVTVVAASEEEATKVENTYGEIRGLLEEMFRLAVEPLPSDDDAREAQFDRFLDLVHSERRGTTMLDNNVLSYTWHPMRRKVNIYLKDLADPGSFTVTRMQPDPVDASTSRVKLFLKARTRMPTPISLRRDAKNRDAWRIESSSL